MKVIVFVLVAAILISGCSENPTKQYQEDADLIRLEHLEYWTQLLDEYHELKGHYPFQKTIERTDNIVLVKIVTNQQLNYLSVGGVNYDKRLDNNPSGFFKEQSVKDFVAALEQALGREIEEKYDIQKVRPRVL